MNKAPMQASIGMIDRFVHHHFIQSPLDLNCARTSGETPAALKREIASGMTYRNTTCAKARAVSANAMYQLAIIPTEYGMSYW